jgi:hypothetical protein
LNVQVLLDFQDFGQDSFRIAVRLLSPFIGGPGLNVLADDDHAQQGELEQVAGKPEQEADVPRFQRHRQSRESQHGEQPRAGHRPYCCSDGNGDPRVDPGVPVGLRMLVGAQHRPGLLAGPDMRVRDMLVKAHGHPQCV